MPDTELNALPAYSKLKVAFMSLHPCLRHVLSVQRACGRAGPQGSFRNVNSGSQRGNSFQSLSVLVEVNADRIAE